MTQYGTFPQENIMNSLRIQPKDISAMLALGHGFIDRIYLLKHTVMLYYYTRQARKIHSILMSFLEHKNHTVQKHREAFVYIEQLLAKRLIYLGKSIQKAQKKGMPSFFVDRLINLEDALSDALFCVQTALDTEFQELLVQLQQCEHEKTKGV